MLPSMPKGDIVDKFGLELSLMSKVFTNDKGITVYMMASHGIVEDVA